MAARSDRVFSLLNYFNICDMKAESDKQWHDSNNVNTRATPFITFE